MQIAIRRPRRIYQFEYVVWSMHFQAFGEDWIPKFGVLDGVSLVYDPDAFYLAGGFRVQ